MCAVALAVLALTVARLCALVGKWDVDTAELDSSVATPFTFLPNRTDHYHTLSRKSKHGNRTTSRPADSSLPVDDARGKIVAGPLSPSERDLPTSDDEDIQRTVFKAHNGHDVRGYDILQARVRHAGVCIRMCYAVPECQAAVFREWRGIPMCFLKNTSSPLVPMAKTTTLVRQVGAAPPQLMSERLRIVATNPASATSEFIRRDGRALLPGGYTIRLHGARPVGHCLSVCYVLEWCRTVVLHAAAHKCNLYPQALSGASKLSSSPLDASYSLQPPKAASAETTLVDQTVNIAPKPPNRGEEKASKEHNEQEDEARGDRRDSDMGRNDPEPHQNGNKEDPERVREGAYAARSEASNNEERNAYIEAEAKTNEMDHLDGSEVAAADDRALQSTLFKRSEGVEVAGADILQGRVHNAPMCVRMCSVMPECQAAVFRAWRGIPTCYLKNASSPLVPIGKTTTFVRQTVTAPPQLMSERLRIATTNPVTATSEFIRRDGRAQMREAIELRLASSEGNATTACQLACYALEWCVVAVVEPGVCRLGGAWAPLDVEAASAVTYALASRHRRLQPRVRIVFLMLAGPRNLNTRVAAALSTWLKHEEVLVYIENSHLEAAEAAVHNLSLRLGFSLNVTVVPLDVLPDPKDSFFHGAGKLLLIMRHLISSTPLDAPWYVAVDDDTFMIPHNLRVALQDAPQNNVAPVYMGEPLGAWKLFGGNAVDGGGGIVLNRAAIVSIRLLLNDSDGNSCFASCTKGGGDIRLACCFKRVGTSPTVHRGFWRFSVFYALGRGCRTEMALFPISFHRMREPPWVYDLHQVVQEAQLNWRLDARSLSSRVVPWEALVHQYRVVWMTRYPRWLYNVKFV